MSTRWNSCDRHSYLAKNLTCMKNYNPRVIARLIDRQMLYHTTWRNLEPPFLELSSSQPVIMAPNVDGTRERLAYGRLGLPKLKKLVSHSDALEVMKALNTINDLVHNPEKACEAIKIGMVDALMNVMLHKENFIREKVAMIFYSLASLEAGRKAITRRYKILQNLGMLVEDKVDAVRHKSQMVIEKITLSPVSSASMNYADYLVLLLRLIGGAPNVEENAMLILHLLTISKLLNRGFEALALKHHALDIFIKKTNHPNEKVVMLALDCIGYLCQTKEGRKEGVEKNLGLILCKKLFYPSMEVRVKVAGALAFATIQSETRSEIAKKCTIEILFEILENYNSSEGQLMAAKVLSNLYEDPNGKAIIKSLRSRIKTVFTNNDIEVERHVKMLLNFTKKNTR